MKTIYTGLLFAVLSTLAACATCAGESRKGTARADENGVFVDGKPFRFLSGEMHYFRIPRGNWKDRMGKLKACGLNTLATYVPWNLHQPSEDEFNFDGIADLDAYLKLSK